MRRLTVRRTEGILFGVTLGALFGWLIGGAL